MNEMQVFSNPEFGSIRTIKVRVYLLEMVCERI